MGHRPAAHAGRQDSFLLAATRPGLGVEFDRAVARAHPFRMTEPLHLRRADGSFTNR